MGVTIDEAGQHRAPVEVHHVCILALQGKHLAIGADSGELAVLPRPAPSPLVGPDPRSGCRR